MKRFLITCSFAIAAQTVFAQYPTIPKTMEDSAEQALAGFKKLSDEAWAKALPIVLADEKKGKPFVLQKPF